MDDQSINCVVASFQKNNHFDVFISSKGESDEFNHHRHVRFVWVMFPLIVKIDMGDKCHMRQIFLLYHLDWGVHLRRWVGDKEERQDASPCTCHAHLVHLSHVIIVP